MLIFGLSPDEGAVHTYKRNNVHKFYLMTNDIEKFIHEMERHGVVFDSAVEAEGGLLTNIFLPGAGRLGVYQPRRARPRELTVR